MAKYDPTPGELEKALDEVYYEIEQLAFTTVLGTNHQGLANAIIESRLLHVRTLIDFFEQSAQAQDDVLAAHYGFAAAPLPIEEVYRRRLNKDLAHLTYSRTTRSPADKQWPHNRVVVPVLERCQSFIDHLLVSRAPLGQHSHDDWVLLRTNVAEVLSRSRGGV